MQPSSKPSGTFAQSTDQDYVDASVPPQARRSWLDLIVVWMGFIIVVGIMAVGGGLAAQLGSLQDVIIVVLIGNLVLAGFAAMAGITGAVSGKSFNLLLKDAYPGLSWKIASLYVPIVLMGWYAVEASIFAHLVATALGVPKSGEMALILFFACFFASSTYFGIRWMIRLSYVFVPLILVVGTWAIMLAARSGNAEFGFDGHLSLEMGVSIVVGSWIMGSLTCIQDITRFARSAKSAALIAVAGMVFANSFTLLSGAAGAALARQSDPALILLALGLLFPALIFSFANIWTTNDNNMYSASLHLANMFSISRRTAVIICIIFGAFFALFEPYKLNVLFSFLGVMGNTAPALGAVVLARFWFITSYPNRVQVGVAAWAGWIGGSALAIMIGGAFSFLIGFAAGGVIYLGMMKVLGCEVAFTRISAGQKASNGDRRREDAEQAGRPSTGS